MCQTCGKKFYAMTKIPSSRIWTSDLWISALFPTTVHRSTNWAIEGTCLLSVNARAKANTRRWGVACFLCFINKSKSGWPRGLRRCVQVAVHFCGRGFESHFWQNIFSTIFTFVDCTTLPCHFVWPHSYGSRVAQWKRAGPITQRSVDRNYALLSFFFKTVKFD